MYRHIFEDLKPTNVPMATIMATSRLP